MEAPAPIHRDPNALGSSIAVATLHVNPHRVTLLSWFMLRVHPRQISIKSLIGFCIYSLIRALGGKDRNTHS
jgi:hypothetical protein